MDDRHERNETNAKVDQARDAAAAARMPTTADRRLQRLQDLREEALDEPNPVRANLRAATADLLEIGYRLGAAIRTTLDRESAGLETYEEVTPAIGSMSLVHRQATRYVQLDREWASEQNAGRGKGRPPATKPQ